jgi:hypothetical protein
MMAERIWAMKRMARPVLKLALLPTDLSDDDP